MSLTVSWHIQCDRCGADDRPGRVCETRVEAEDEFERRGWSFVDGEIRCQDCAESEAAAQ